MPTEVAIYGAGACGREFAWMVEQCSERPDPLRMVCFVDDEAEKIGKEINGYPVLLPEEARRSYPKALIVGGVAQPGIRERLMEQAKAAGFDLATLIHPDVACSRWVKVGNGTVICGGSFLTVNIDIGRHVHINLGCTLGHDVVLGDYVTLFPGVHLSGCVQIGKRTSIGAGAVIINGTQQKPILIGKDVAIGAGAVVIGDVPDGVTVVGVPAKPV